MVQTNLLVSWTTRPPLTLVVDHDADTRKLYAQYLTLSDCDVEEAEDGREALAKAISRQPDIVVTESRLPGISGFDLCELLRRDTMTRNIPIVCVTGDTQQAHRVEMAGADAVLVKPCLPEQLLAEIYRLLDQSAELTVRARALRQRVSSELERAAQVRARSELAFRRTILSHSFARAETTEPPAPPPPVMCPKCDRPLRYLRSHVGGVSARHPEQWDYFECSGGCGTFQYRQRTRKLRHISI